MASPLTGEQQITAVVLAAGLSSRMGQSKHLLTWLNGKAVIEQIISQVIAAGIRDILVVTGSRAEEVAAKVQPMGARTIYNPDYASHEMLTSLKLGLRTLPERITGVLVVLGDQPGIQAEAIRQIVAAFTAGKGSIIAPVYQGGERGHPMLISQIYFKELLALPEHGAPRQLIARHTEQVYNIVIESPASTRAPADLDTPEDYARELQRAQNHST